MKKKANKIQITMNVQVEVRKKESRRTLATMRPFKQVFILQRLWVYRSRAWRAAFTLYDRIAREEEREIFPQGSGEGRSTSIEGFSQRLQLQKSIVSEPGALAALSQCHAPDIPLEIEPLDCKLF